LGVAGAKAGVQAEGGKGETDSDAVAALLRDIFGKEQACTSGRGGRKDEAKSGGLGEEAEGEDQGKGEAVVGEEAEEEKPQVAKEAEAQAEGALTTVITIDGVSATVDHKSNEVSSDDAALRDRVRRVLDNVRLAMLPIDVGC
jgi:hypothetical protein